MITYGIMTFILLFLAGLLLVGAEYKPDSKHFFDIDNTNALRGFWCLIVVLVHIPAVYQNPIQDMIGSFAYIGVTFFFMTSAYGLRLAVDKKPESIAPKEVSIKKINIASVGVFPFFQYVLFVKNS